MIGAFNKIVKRLVGDKAATDVKAIQPAVDAVHTFESEMQGLSSDGLRERSADLKRRILNHVEEMVDMTFTSRRASLIWHDTDPYQLS